MRTSATSVLGVAVTFLAVPTLGRNTHSIIRTLQAPGTYSGGRGLLDRLSHFLLRRHRPVMDVNDFLLNGRNFENLHKTISPDVLQLYTDSTFGDWDVNWLLEWIDSSCLSGPAKTFLDSLLDFLFSRCGHFRKIQDIMKAFLEAIMKDCGDKSKITRFIKWLVNTVLSECNDNTKPQKEDWLLRAVLQI
ncbi:uncharacterized protein [Periplaneta americana]|uniref:uncharacterized protein isoform X4 n=1 Tax=Periplaneta americana TaxID=6978 RepID=UPI0037E91CD8